MITWIPSEGDWATVRRHMQQHPDATVRVEYKGITPGHSAVLEGNPDAIPAGALEVRGEPCRAVASLTIYEPGEYPRHCDPGLPVDDTRHCDDPEGATDHA